MTVVAIGDGIWETAGSGDDVRLALSPSVVVVLPVVVLVVVAVVVAVVVVAVVVVVVL